MCGIVGAIDLSGENTIVLERIGAMAAAIRHRGPDGDGYYTAGAASPSYFAMGMRRLSIIDVAGGDQPIGNEDGSIQIVYNGETYNYVELMDDLRTRGHHFRTACDTETIVHLYEEHGLDLFAKLRGMYAFALWDERRRRLVLAVDHIGIKPLYTCRAGSRLFFASEAKALLAYGAEIPRELNPDALDTFLSAGFAVGQETLFKGIRRLAAGTALVIENGEIREVRHWLPDYTPTDSTADAVERVRATLEDAVRLHLRSDVPLGLFLSGGLDSAGLLALMAKLQPGRIKTFSVGYADGQHGDNELDAAHASAQVFESEHHELVLSAADWWDNVARYVYHHDEPNANPSAVSLLALSEVAARSVKVVLNGIGSDELFGGYPYHRALPQALRRAAHHLLPTPLRKGTRALLSRVEALYPLLSHYRIVGAIPNLLPDRYYGLDALPVHLRRAMTFDARVFSDALRGTLLTPEVRAGKTIDDAFASLLALAPDMQPENLVHFLVMYLWLPGNGLLSADKVSLAHSLEGRVPYFDRALMELATSIPPEVRNRENKYLLRAAMRTILPDAIRTRPKKPFGTPIRAWFEGPLRPKLQEILYDPAALSRPYFEPRVYRRIIDAHFAGCTSQTELIWRLVNLELWNRTFIDAPTFRAAEPLTPALAV